MFAVLGFLTVSGSVKHKNTFTFAAAAVGLITGLFYGAITELLQFYCLEGRHGNMADAIANGFGTVFGVIISGIIYGNRNKK